MWIVLLMCVGLCLIMGFFVILPLVSEEEGNLSSAFAAKGFSDEHELRQTLVLRDALFSKLISGKASTEAVDGLSEGDALDALVSVCERLRRFDFPILPEKTKPLIAWLVALPLLFGAATMGAFAPHKALAQAASGERMSIPTLYKDPQSGLNFPSLHQFVISPRMGQVQVFYLGVFFNREAPGTASAEVALPFPEGFEDFRLGNKEGMLQAKGTSFPVVTVPLKEGVNELRAEFTLPASLGTIHWANPVLPSLPGTLLILMPEYQSALRNMLESVAPELNLWPARLADVPSDFKSERTQEEYNPADPNYAMLSKMPPEFTRNLLRNSVEPVPFPEFRIVGIVPSRVPLYSLGGLFAAFLFGTAGFTVAKAGRNKKSS